MNTDTIKMFDYRDQYLQLEEEILKAVQKVLRSGELILATEVDRFETSFSEFLGTDMHCLGVANGTDAIVVCLMALGIGPGDEVITVANTAVPTVSAIRMVKATPVFVDVDPNTALMDINKVQSLITPKTRAIIPVHLFGNAVDIPALQRIAQRHHIPIIEDCAQAHGTMLNGQMVGTFGTAAAFSFYPTKNLGAYGDAGLCASSDSTLAKEMRRVRKYGFDDLYYAEREGINSRLDEIHAAILNIKLTHLPEQLQRRRDIARAYQADLPKRLQALWPGPGVEHSYHLFVVKTQNRDSLRNALGQRHIQTGIHYPYPIHLMRGYEFLGYSEGSLPVTEALARDIVSLPMYPELPLGSVQRVLEALHELLG
jgi:dTDP-3-amino-2,3,6-trideoxy-4-keto-D-glucose/dTDP-3-amino-3,4,6-trideoxy-alpha-D-glucose/dTDP-2,6-dideoxy-D-kanosamine transaminase